MQLEEEGADNGEDTESGQPQWDRGSDQRIHGLVG